MLELILLTSIATKTVYVDPALTVSAPVSTSAPVPAPTPAPIPVTIPVTTPTPKPSYVTPPTESWSEKMLKRYKERVK